MKKTELSVSIVVGFDGLVSPPSEASMMPEMRRVAIIFRPNRGEDTEWSSYFHLYVEIIARIKAFFNNCSTMIQAEEGVFKNISNYERFISSKIPSEDRFPPEKVVFFSKKTLAVVNSESWMECGGPAPYSDSYTISFYVNGDKIRDAVLSKIRDVCSLHNVPVIRIINVMNKPVGASFDKGLHPWSVFMLFKKFRAFIFKAFCSRVRIEEDP